MNTAETVKTITEKVIDNRDNHTPRHPMTTAYDSSIFTNGEASEFDDAFLRLNPRYIRNNAKDIDPEIEIGDTFYMAATTIMALDRHIVEDDVDARTAFLRAKISIHIANSQIYISNGRYKEGAQEMVTAMTYLVGYSERMGIDPIAAVDKSIEKFRRKFGGEDGS